MIEALKIAQKIIRENAFEHEKETWVKFNPGLSANRSSNNWAQGIGRFIPKYLGCARTVRTTG